MSEEVYTVEKILERKKVGSRFRYHLKWLGYEETTWEDESNLIGCEELVQEYEKRMEEAKAKSASPLSTQKTSKSSSNATPITPRAASNAAVSKPTPTRQKRRISHDEKKEDPAPKKEAPREAKYISDKCDFDGEPEEIVTARRHKEQLYLGVRFQGQDKVSTYYLSSLLNEAIPQLVIKFYESRLKFETPKPNEGK